MGSNVRPLVEVNTSVNKNYPTPMDVDVVLEPQMGDMQQKVQPGQSMVSSQNVSYQDQEEGYMYNEPAPVDPTRKLLDSDDADLGNFFSRPLKIASYDWGTGTTLAQDFDPWDLYFSNPRVENRITNFNLMRAKLHLKVIINGNGFQYGRAILAYNPLDTYDEISTHSALVSADLVQTSQLPHIYLDPTTSSGGEMILPFYYHKNYVEIPTREFSELGQVYLRSLNALKHANGATDQVTISIFAWAEDVSLSVLTSVDIDALTPQSGEVAEANNKGMISGPATTLAKVAGALSAIPQIKPFALATQAVLTGIAGGAKMLGYCRPPVTKNPEPFRPTPISHLAATTVPDTALKLTIDDQQELTIDPTIAGVGPMDPMNIRNIASRESYLTTFDWAVGTGVETLLWNARLDPVTWAESGSTAYHFPACAMAALPFKYWTGTMKFRFQIVCSTFHKGRLKFVYDPQYLASNEYNTNYLRVIDIADTQDFTIELGNGQNKTLLKHHRPGLDSVTQMYSTTAYTAQEEGNGVIGVYVVNELTVPNSVANNDIQVNVFVSMGDDFEVFVPDDHFQYFTVQPTSAQALNLAPIVENIEDLEPQSGMMGNIVPESQGTEEPSAPVQKNTEMIAMPEQDTRLINKVFTGESILSFRPLLKRYNLFRRHIISPTSSMSDWFFTCAWFPFLRGEISGAVDTTAALTNYNYCNTVLLHWVTLAHQGFRGSIRWKFLFDQVDISSSSNVTSKVYVERFMGGANPYEWTASSSASYSINSEAAWEIVLGSTANEHIPTGVRGTAFTTSSINPNIEFEVPYYSDERFTPGKILNWTTSVSQLFPCLRMFARTYGTNRANVDMHTATGEDFQVYFWTGLPRMYYEATPPAA